MNKDNLQSMREEYSSATLSENSVDADPIKQFEIWFEAAQEVKVPGTKRHDACYFHY